MHYRLGRLSGAVTLMLALVASRPAAAATISFQNGVAPTSAYTGTQDTSIKFDVPATNYGTAVTDTIDGSPDQSVLIKWDVSAVPAGSIVARPSENAMQPSKETGITRRPSASTYPSLWPI